MRKLLYTFETDRISGMTEGEHSAPILTPTAWGDDELIPDLDQLATETYFYRGTHGQVAGPGLFGRLPPQLWSNPATPLYVLLDPDVDY